LKSYERIYRSKRKGWENDTETRVLKWTTDYNGVPIEAEVIFKNIIYYKTSAVFHWS
jgi:hypothetical protein